MDKFSGILAFVRAAEARSFAQAARVLDMTASGVGKSIARLEAELGVRLLSRTTRSVTLTDDGAVFFEHCRRLLDDLDAAHNLVSSRGIEAQGRLKISVPMTLGKLYIVPRLPSFIARHPQITLELSLSDRRVSLVDEGIDVAVRIGTLADSGLVARSLWHQQVITIAPPAFVAERPITTIADLSAHRCLQFRMPTTGRERPWLFKVGGAPFEWRPRVSVTFDEGEALVEAVRAGLGVTQAPGYMAQSALERGEVIEVLADHRPDPSPIAALFSSQRNLPARTRAFVDWLCGLPGPPLVARKQGAAKRGRMAGSKR